MDLTNKKDVNSLDLGALIAFGLKKCECSQLAAFVYERLLGFGVWWQKCNSEKQNCLIG